MTSPVTPGSSQPYSREEVKRLYQQGIGGTFFRQMMKALRSSTGKAAYFNGGQAEKIFQGQLDELLIEKMSEASGDIFSDEMFDQQFPEYARQDQPLTAQAGQTSPQSGGDEEPGDSIGFDASV